MKFPFMSLSPKVFIFGLLILVGIPVTVFLVSQQQNLSQDANEIYPGCAPDVPPSGWPECRYGQSTYNTQACRNRAEEHKGIDGPRGENERAWFNWAQDPPKPLSCGTACGLAPSFCIVDNPPSNTPVPSPTPEEPTATPRPSRTPTPTPTPTDVPPTPTDVPPTPTEGISSCPVPQVSADGLNVRIECPYCEQ